MAHTSGPDSSMHGSRFGSCCGKQVAKLSSSTVCVQVSFVNSICTIKGGTHVNYIVDQITK